MNKVLRATLASAVVITTVIGIASFVLSFAALWDLATMAGVPRTLSWLWPVIVDGTILQATISVIALAGFEEQRAGRRFFWWVLIIAALVSIGANAMHAFISGAGSLHPAVSAVIATVAPISLLAATHGLGILVRIPVPDPPDSTALPDAMAASPVPDTARLQVPRVPTLDTAPSSAHTSALADAMRERERERGVPGAGPVDERKPTDSPSVEAWSGDTRMVETRAAEPLDEVDRWILDEDRVEDLYPVDAP